jgi:cation/acetate symporter
MPHRQGAHLVNPMVGVYFGIFVACLAAGVVLLLILEQLGVTEASLKTAMAAISVSLFATIGAGAYANRARDYLLAGRRIPAFYNGISLAVASLGGAGLAGISGALFVAGFDMLFLGLGIVAGLTVSVMLLAPFLRKFGAPTIPSYLGQRFESGGLRLLAASIAVIPLLLLAIAEIKVGMIAAQFLVPIGAETSAALIAMVVVVTVAPGGARSLSWSTAAQAMVVLIAVMLPAAIAAVMETNLPFGQLSHGPLMRALGRVEAVQDVPIPVASSMALELPEEGLQPIVGRFATAFGSVGPVAFVLATLSILAGVAGAPTLLGRAVATPSVYDTRKSIGWAVALVGLLLLTFSSVAVFERDVLLTNLAGQPATAIPPGLQRLVDLGLAAVDGDEAKLTATSILFDRDGMLVALPVLMGMPLAVVNLVAAGVLAASLAGAAASLTQLGLIVGEDVVHGPAGPRASDIQRVATCRVAIVGATGLAGTGAAVVDGDPLALMLYAIALTGSAIFPVLALSIWWKRITSAGAISGLLAGSIAALVVLLADVNAMGLSRFLAPVVGLPAALIATLVVSQLTPVPGRHILEMVRDLRIPGGETIHDREQRQARQRGQRTR